MGVHAERAEDSISVVLVMFVNTPSLEIISNKTNEFILIEI